MKKLTILVFLILLNCSNNSINNNLNEGISFKNELEKIVINVPENKRKLYLSDVLDTAYLIPLGGNAPEFHLGKILDVEFYKSKYYVLDNKTKDQCICVFSEDGSLIRKIGNAGAGPEEYLEAHQININPFHDYLDVLDRSTLEITRYGLDGSFIEKFIHGIKAQEITEVSDSTYALFTANRLNFELNSEGEYDSITYNVYFTDNQLKPIKYQFPFNYSQYRGLSFTNISHFHDFSKGYHLMIPLNDTLYSIEPGKLNFLPKTLIEYSKKPKNDLFKMASYDAKDIIRERPEFAYMTSQYWETKNTIFFEYAYMGNEYVTFVNREHNQVSTGVPVNDFYGFFPNIYEVSEDNFIGISSYDQLNALYSEYLKYPESKSILQLTGGKESLKNLSKYLDSYDQTDQFLVILKPK